jgi:hypothetical protein
MLHTSLAASVDVLSSVTAFRNVGGIIGKKGDGVKGEMTERSGGAKFHPARNENHLDYIYSAACARVLLEWVAHYFHRKR